MSKYIVCRYVTKVITERHLVELNGDREDCFPGEFLEDHPAIREISEYNIYEEETTKTIVNEKYYVERTWDSAEIDEDEFGGKTLHFDSDVNNVCDECETKTECKSCEFNAAINRVAKGEAP